MGGTGSIHLIPPSIPEVRFTRKPTMQTLPLLLLGVSVVIASRAPIDAGAPISATTKKLEYAAITFNATGLSSKARYSQCKKYFRQVKHSHQSSAADSAPKGKSLDAPLQYLAHHTLVKKSDWMQVTVMFSSMALYPCESLTCP
jgi:hypothetical protein